MQTVEKGLMCAVAAVVSGFTPVFSQDRFPAPIPRSGIAVEVRTIAVLPDSTTGQPPRINVLTQDPAGRLFANDQRGPLYRIDEAAGAAAEYLDLRDYAALAILSTSEAGFQSFAFHPDFHVAGAPGHGRFYTLHSSSNTAPLPDFDPGGTTRFHCLLLEWRVADPAAGVFAPANPAAPYRELMRLKQPFDNHNGGLIAFNPLAGPAHADYGNLYVAFGDGGSSGDPQENGEDPSNPFGAILRIDPLGAGSANGKYGIVAENLLAADGDPATLGEIWCYGLRNPQRFGWDIRDGRCFIADIGQDAVEEINLAANGANFGWDTREGSFPREGTATAGLTDPAAEYDHTNTVSDPPTAIANRAVTVGEVVRGACIPALEGKLPLADFPTGLIFILDADTDPLDGGQDGLSEVLLLDGAGQQVRFLQLVNAARAARGLAAVTRTDLRFSVNTPGRLYLTNKHDGHIRRVIPTVPPAIAVAPAPAGGLDFSFTGILQSSADLQAWRDLLPQPTSPHSQPAPGPAPVFFRAVRR